MSKVRNVLVVTSSPRQGGNSTELAARIAMGCREAGANVETIDVSRLKIDPCLACDWCHTPDNVGEGCLKDDDMASVYASVRRSQALVLATPVYMFTMTAQLKLFLDRLYAIMSEGDLVGGYSFKGVKVALAMTYGDEDVYKSGGVNALRAVEDLCNYLGAQFVGAVYGTAEKPGDIVANGALLEKAFELGKVLASEA